jgi:hypothetical protein
MREQSAARPSDCFSLLFREEQMIENPTTLGSIFGPFPSDYGLSHHQISCYALHDWLRFFLFPLSDPSRRSCAEQPTRVSAGASAKRIRKYDTWKHLRTSGTLAPAG